MRLTMFLTSYQCTHKKIKDALGTIKKIEKNLDNSNRRTFSSINLNNRKKDNFSMLRMC